MSETLDKKNLFCDTVNGMSNYKKEKESLAIYRGFRISALRLIVEYSFPGFTIKIEPNHKKHRFDIFLSKVNKETSQEIDAKEVEKFRKFYGSGFHILILEEA